MQQPMSPFTWGANGEQLTPEQLSKRRQLISALMPQGPDFSPVGHWTQGLARVANAAAGNIAANRLEDVQRTQAGFPVRPGGFFGFRAAPGSFLAGGRGVPGLY